MKRKIKYSMFKKQFMKKVIDFDMFEFTQTLNKTDFYHWYFYVPKYDITCMSDKETDIILKIWDGKKFS